MTNTLIALTVKLPADDFRRIPSDNRSEFVRAAVAEKLARTPVQEWQPKTPRGKRLLELSNRFEGERLNASAIAEEIRLRRGGLA